VDERDRQTGIELILVAIARVPSGIRFGEPLRERKSRSRAGQIEISMNMHVVNFRFILAGIRASPRARSVAAPRVSPGADDEQIRLALAKHVATLFSVMTRSRFTNILQGTRFPGTAENPPVCRM